ncbi:hypothetical protein [Thioalkalivibrio sulfidiphilus]|uniref:hypothetical protein n=1 Tax=Thioalkalivibrio sulfidiphilus TaxID=1033854 RepID=UPI0002E107AD|nr:hypothetical protein [Thioalkalivibrio sulfidiphilus]
MLTDHPFDFLFIIMLRFMRVDFVLNHRGLILGKHTQLLHEIQAEFSTTKGKAMTASVAI